MRAPGLALTAHRLLDYLANVMGPPRPPMITSPRICAVACAIAIAFATAAAQAAPLMYKWVDKDGRIVYSDQPPPPNVKSEIIKPPPPPSNPNAAQELAEKQLEQKGREKKQQEAVAVAERNRVELERRRENCQRARAQLKAMLEQGDTTLWYREDENGQRVILDPAARAASIENQQAFIRDACS